MYIICGLGNPGRDYERTRHNMGFMTIDKLAEALSVSVTSLKFNALVGETRVGREKVILVKPQTFMNNSGEALRPLADYYKVPAENILVIYDDCDLPVGKLRIRGFGSSGSHNGMKSLVQHLGTDKFPRVRIGLGDKGPMDLRDFVLGRPTSTEAPLINDCIERAAKACEMFVTDGIEKTMAAFNKK